MRVRVPSEAVCSSSPSSLQKAREDYALKAEMLRLELTSSFEEARQEDIEATHLRVEERQSTLLEKANAEHRAATAAQVHQQSSH